MSFYTVKNIYPWLFSIYDPLGSYCYLVVGNDMPQCWNALWNSRILRKSIDIRPKTPNNGIGGIKK